MEKLVCTRDGQETTWYFTLEETSDWAGRVWKFVVFREKNPDGPSFSAQFHEIEEQKCLISEGLEAPEAFRRKGIPLALFALISQRTGLPLYSSCPVEGKWWLDFEQHSEHARRMWKGLIGRGVAVWYPKLDRFKYAPRTNSRPGRRCVVRLQGVSSGSWPCYSLAR